MSNAQSRQANHPTNTATSAATSLAALSVDHVIGGTAGRVGGALVQPAVWVVSRQAPDAGDVFIWGLGLFRTGPGIAVGLLKGLADDYTATRVSAAAADEPARYRPFIKAAHDYGFFEQGGAISSMTIASKGGACWQKEGGLWVYITDARGLLVPDYVPQRFIELRRPKLPLVPTDYGRFELEILRP